MTKQDTHEEGWSFFKKGAIGQRGKNHYLANWKSICGMYQVSEEDRKYMHFVDKTALRQRKICNTCEKKLKIRKEDEEFEKKFGEKKYE